MKIVLASNNKKKMAEMRSILSEIGLSVVSPAELGLELEVEETGTTFEENAALKAFAFMEAAGMPAVADDSGLSVDALDGEPGVYSARYGGDAVADDEGRCEFLLQNLRGVKERSAQFVSAIVCAFPNGDSITVRGEVQGEILESGRGEGGFGYDPLFWIPEYGMTMAEMDADFKNSISHRAKALGLLKDRLKERLSD